MEDGGGLLITAGNIKEIEETVGGYVTFRKTAGGFKWLQVVEVKLSSR